MEIKNDSTLEVSCKRTMLAVLVKWYVVNFKRNPKSKAELLRTILEEAERSIIESGIAEPVETLDEAVAILENAGITGLNRLGRATKGLKFNMRINKNIEGVDEGEIVRGARKFLSDNSIIPKNEDYSIPNLKEQLSRIPEEIVVDKSEERSE